MAERLYSTTPAQCTFSTIDEWRQSNPDCLFKLCITNLWHKLSSSLLCHVVAQVLTTLKTPTGSDFTKWICFILWRSQTHISSGNGPLTPLCSQPGGSFSVLSSFFLFLHPSPVHLFSHWKPQLSMHPIEQHRLHFPECYCAVDIENDRWNRKYDSFFHLRIEFSQCLGPPLGL